jgi:transposase
MQTYWRQLMTTLGLDLTPETIAERMASTGRLTRAGWSSQEIAVRVGVTQRTVTRYRARLRAGKNNRTLIAA